MGNFEKDKSTTYTLNKRDNGVYLFVLEGAILVEDLPLERRDGLGIMEVEKINITATAPSKVLLMEVPMSN